MASITTESNGHRRLLFTDSDGRRKSIRLGKLGFKSAQTIARHIESLLAAREHADPVPPVTAVWIKSIGETLRSKLAQVGLVDQHKKVQLGEFLNEYILSRPDIKPATREVWQQPCRNLRDYFGADKPLRSITPGDGDRFKAWLMTQPLATATIAKRLSFARTFFHVARKHKLIDENPFCEVKIPTANVAERQRFVDRDTVQKLLDRASPSWRTIIALSRFGGLRCPSEVLSLEWRHVDWDRRRITVPSPKTERYDGKASRVIPLFCDLMPYLMEAFRYRHPDQTHVIGGDYLERANRPTGWKSCNLRTALTRLIRQSKVPVWPRLFHNLRSSRETELLETFPLHVVAQWMGHDAKVSLKHYAQTTEQHFARAAGGANSGSPVEQIPAQHGIVVNRSELQTGR